MKKTLFLLCAIFCVSSHKVAAVITPSSISVRFFTAVLRNTDRLNNNNNPQKQPKKPRTRQEKPLVYSRSNKYFPIGTYSSKANNTTIVYLNKQLPHVRDPR